MTHDSGGTVRTRPARTRIDRAPRSPAFEPTGRVRRFFWRHPRAMDTLVCIVTFFGLSTASGIFLGFAAMVPADQGWGVLGLTPWVAAVVSIVAVLIHTTAMWWRRTRPVVSFIVVAICMVTQILVVGQLEPFVAALSIYAVAAYASRRSSLTALGVVAIISLGTYAFMLNPWLGTVPAASYEAGYIVGSELAGTPPQSTESEAPLDDSTTVDTTSPPDDALTAEDLAATGETPLIMWTAFGLLAAATLAFFGFAYSMGRNVRGRRQYMIALEERAAALILERDQQALIATQAERNRIAREMHDVVAHSLTVMIALADGARTALDRAPDAARNALDQAAETGRDALTEMRRVLGALTAAEGDEPVLTPVSGSITDLVEDIRATGRRVTYGSSGPEIDPSSAIGLSIYRIIQESLTNALRYAPIHSPIIVFVESRAGDVRVTVDSTLRADAVASVGSGRGLIGMRERVAILGGIVDAGPAAHDSIWRVRAVIPDSDDERIEP